MTCALALLAVALHFKPKNKPIATFLVLYLFILYVAFSHPVSGVFTAFLAAITIIFGKFFWYLCLAATEKGSDRNILQVLYFHPFWTDRPAPIPQGWKALKDFEIRNDNEAAKARTATLWTLTRLLICHALVACLYYFFYNHPTSLFLYIKFLPSLKIPAASVMGFHYINQLHLSLFDLWMVQLSTTCEFLLYFIITYDTIVFIARLAGFLIPHNTSKPFTASTFHEFLGKTMYYYNKTLVRTFFSPIYYQFSFIRPSALRTFLAVFIAVFCFGSAYHFFALQHQLISLGFHQTFWKFAQVVPYFATLSLLVAISVVIERTANKRQIFSRGFLRIILPAFCFTLYSLCITMIVGHYMKSQWMDHKVFLLSLFGL